MSFRAMAPARPLLAIRAATIGRIALLSGLLSVTAATRQTVPVTTLSKPLAEFPEGFTSLSSVRELPNGWVMVVEQCERVVKLLDFSKETAPQLGRTGSGPEEYRGTGRLLMLPGDSTLMFDGGNRRYLVIHSDGTPGRTLPPLPSVSQSSPTASVTILSGSAAASDRLGNLYSREGDLRVLDGRLISVDSVAILRWHYTSQQRDTVGFQAVLAPQGPVNPGRTPPFASGIQWAVAPDGRIALTDPRDYHVEFIAANGSRSTGRPISFSRVPLSSGHKQQWRDEQQPACPGPSSGTTTDPTTGRTIRFSRAAIREPEASEWPEYLPPFPAGSASFASDGVLWVRRTVAAEDPPAYDLIDGTGRVLHRVVLVKRAKLLGFGKGTLYVLRVDEDDLQYLQRYRLPNTERP